MLIEHCAGPSPRGDCTSWSLSFILGHGEPYVMGSAIVSLLGLNTTCDSYTWNNIYLATLLNLSEVKPEMDSSV